MAEEATQKDIVLDLLSILDGDVQSGRIFGGDSTTIDKVEEYVPESWNGSGKDCLIITLDNGQRFRVQVREEPKG